MPQIFLNSLFVTLISIVTSLRSIAPSIFKEPIVAGVNPVAPVSAKYRPLGLNFTATTDPIVLPSRYPK